MKIQKISFYNTNSFTKKNNTSKPTLTKCANEEYKLLNTLNALSLNSKAQISFSKSSLDIEHLKSVKPKIRISKV